MEWTRRDVLRGLAGAMLAPTACERPPAPIEARFVGQDPARGHRLREAGLRELVPTERLRTPVLVIGSGVAGAAAAWRLRRAGLGEFVMLELEPDIGGTARGGVLPRSPYPMGAHYLPVPHPSFTGLHTLLDDLGLRLEAGDAPEYDPTAICRSPVERVKHRHTWHEGIYPAAGQTPDEEQQWLRWLEHLRALDGRRGADGRRLFDLPVQRSSTELRHLDRISMATYLDRLGFTSWRLRFVIDYACRDDYGCRIDETSAFAALHHDLCRGLEDARDRPLLTRADGNAHLVRSMIERAELGERLRTDTAAAFVDPDSGRVLAYDLASDRAVAIEAEVVVWAAPRFVLPHVLPPGRDPLDRQALTYVPWLVSNVEVDRRPAGIGAPLAWDNVDAAAEHLGYVVANHGEPLTERHREGAVLTFYEPWTASDREGLQRRRAELLDSSLDALVQRTVAALDAMHPGLASTVRRVDVARWGHAMIRPTPGLLFGPGLASAAAPIGRVLPCATDVRGLPLFEEAWAGGVSAAETALARLGRPTATLLGS